MSSLNRIYFLRSSTVLFHIAIAATGLADFIFTSQLDVHRIDVEATDWLHLAQTGYAAICNQLYHFSHAMHPNLLSLSPCAISSCMIFV